MTRDAQGRVDVLRPDGVAEPVAGVVCDSDCVVYIGEADTCCEHGPENLLTKDPHLRSDMVEDRGLDEDPALPVAGKSACRARHELCSFVRPGRDVVEHFPRMPLVNHRSKVCVFVMRLADAQLLRSPR